MVGAVWVRRRGRATGSSGAAPEVGGGTGPVGLGGTVVSTWRCPLRAQKVVAPETGRASMRTPSTVTPPSEGFSSGAVLDDVPSELIPTSVPSGSTIQPIVVVRPLTVARPRYSPAGGSASPTVKRNFRAPIQTVPVRSAPFSSASMVAPVFERSEIRPLAAVPVNHASTERPSQKYAADCPFSTAIATDARRFAVRPAYTTLSGNAGGVVFGGTIGG